jgi:lysyl oxidase/Big-like domain-containing protein
MGLSRNISRSLAWLGLAVTLMIGFSSAYALRQAHASGAEELPNLVADPPDNTLLETSSVEGSSRLLLRFNGYVHNVGPGALDFRGSREKPKVSKATEEEVERAREHEASLPPKTETELASPPMKVFQRVFTTSIGQEETNIERAHKEEQSEGEMLYVSADGHHHWHLQRVAKYSLWNAAKTAEMAPAQKVGFCLEDSEHVETAVGPKAPVYADNVPPFRDFCQQYRPNASSLFEGISPGWRDAYRRELAFQWVDVSNVLPGEYWLREDVNPLNVIKEAGGANAPAYARTPTIVPGFDALAQSTSTPAGEAKTVKLTSTAWSDSATPKYTIVAPPQHGTLGAVSKNQVTYTPEAGFTGSDSFTFSAADPSSQFPQHPATATVSIEVAESSAPVVTIEGAPSSLPAGTSVQLSAHVVNDGPSVTWSASAGSITSSGLYTAPPNPPAGGSVTITATSSKGAKGQRTIEITPVAWVPLAGDSGSKYEVADQTEVGHEEAFAFTAKSTGTVEELQFLTDRVPNIGVSGLEMAVFTDSAGKPGQVLGTALAAGEPATSSWIKATGVAASVTAGKQYWLVVLPLGSGSAELHFNAAKPRDQGSGNLESTEGELTKAIPESSWETYNQGPVGFEALGAATSVTIEGAPLSMAAGSGVQLSAHVLDGPPGVNWSASAGAVSPGGFYTAPSEPPAGGSVTVTATSSNGVQDQRTIEITPAGLTPAISISGAQSQMTAGTGVELTASVSNDSGGVDWSVSGGGTLSPEGTEGLKSLYTAPSAAGTVTITARLRDRPTVSAQQVIAVALASVPIPAPEGPPTATGATGSAGFTVSSPHPGLTRPRAMLIGRKLVISTRATVGGRVRLSAYLNGRRLGTCAALTPAGRPFTCDLTLGSKVSLRARISVLASLRLNSLILKSWLRAARIPQMKMKPAGRSAHASSLAGRFWCSPSTLLPTVSSSG